MEISLKHNEFWGKRSGFIHPKEGPIIRISRKGNAKTGNSGPTGWKRKRAPKNYTNNKLRRKGKL